MPVCPTVTAYVKEHSEYRRRRGGRRWSSSANSGAAGKHHVAHPNSRLRRLSCSDPKADHPASAEARVGVGCRARDSRRPCRPRTSRWPRRRCGARGSRARSTRRGRPATFADEKTRSAVRRKPRQRPCRNAVAKAQAVHGRPQCQLGFGVPAAVGAHACAAPPARTPRIRPRVQPIDGAPAICPISYRTSSIRSAVSRSGPRSCGRASAATPPPPDADFERFRVRNGSYERHPHQSRGSSPPQASWPDIPAATPDRPARRKPNAPGCGAGSYAVVGGRPAPRCAWWTYSPAAAASRSGCGGACAEPAVRTDAGDRPRSGRREDVRSELPPRSLSPTTWRRCCGPRGLPAHTR